jgi:hypothetical protein
MAGNPFLKADDKLLRVNGNTAHLTFVDTSTTYDETTGEMAVETKENTVTIPISNPTVISEHIVDGKNYIAGDLKFETSRLALESSLPSTRYADMQNCGIDKKNDRISIGTVTYAIVRVEPANLWNNDPSRYKLHVRMI